MNISVRELWNSNSDEITGEPHFGVEAVTGAQPALVNIETAIYNPTDKEVKEGSLGYASFDIERNSDQSAMYQWLHSYEQSRQEFQDEHVERANKLAKTSPAMAIIAARQVLEIPYRGKLNTMFSHGGGVWISDIAEAYGINYDNFSTHKKVNDLHKKIFEVPNRTKENMRSIIEKSRASLASTALVSWQEAVGGYQDMSDKQAVGMSYAEIARIFKEMALADPTVSNLNNSMISLVDGIKDFHGNAGVKETVELDELHYYLSHIVKSIAGQDQKLSKLVDKEALKYATYTLDDYGENLDSIVSGYRYLSKVLPLGKGKLFFSREVKEITAQKELTDLLDAGHVVFGGRFRKNHRDSRP